MPYLFSSQLRREICTLCPIQVCKAKTNCLYLVGETLESDMSDFHFISMSLVVESGNTV